jgi:uncharacterized protein YjiS (DUF1127 family)
MIMSTTSKILSRSDAAAETPLQGLIRTLKRWWAAYIDWRLCQMAAAQLRSMSDRELKDIGLFRAQIEAAVRGDLARDPTLRRYY